MFIATGVGPYSGQSVHFQHYALGSNDYAVNRYNFEADRHWRIVDAQLAKSPFMLGDVYTIVDMAVWGWARAAPFIFGATAWQRFPNVKRLLDELSARPAAQRAHALAERFAFKEEMDATALAAMFPQNTQLKP